MLRDPVWLLATFKFTAKQVIRMSLWRVHNALRLVKTFLGTEQDVRLQRVLDDAAATRSDEFGHCRECGSSLSIVWWGADAVKNSLCCDCGTVMHELHGMRLLGDASRAGREHGSQWLRGRVCKAMAVFRHTGFNNSDEVLGVPSAFQTPDRPIWTVNIDKERSYHSRHFRKGYRVGEFNLPAAVACKTFQNNTKYSSFQLIHPEQESGSGGDLGGGRDQGSGGLRDLRHIAIVHEVKERRLGRVMGIAANDDRRLWLMLVTPTTPCAEGETVPKRTWLHFDSAAAFNVLANFLGNSANDVHATWYYLKPSHSDPNNPSDALRAVAAVFVVELMTLMALEDVAINKEVAMQLAKLSEVKGVADGIIEILQRWCEMVHVSDG